MWKQDFSYKKVGISNDIGYWINKIVLDKSFQNVRNILDLNIVRNGSI